MILCDDSNTELLLSSPNGRSNSTSTTTPTTQEEGKIRLEEHKETSTARMSTFTLAPRPLEDEDDVVDGIHNSTFDLSEVMQRIDVMANQEDSEAYKIYDYRNKTNTKKRQLSNACTTATGTSSSPVDEECRVRMIEWCYRVVDYCNFQRNTVHYAVSYLDRYLCSTIKKGVVDPTGPILVLKDRSLYQIAVMTCLFIAIKVHESNREIRTDLLSQLSPAHEDYCEEDFLQMEIKILTSLQWKLHGPSPMDFIQALLLLGKDCLPTTDEDDDILHEIVQYSTYQVEIAIVDFMSLPPSELALAAIINSVIDMEDTLFPFKCKVQFFETMEQYTHLTVQDVLPIQANLRSLVNDII